MMTPPFPISPGTELRVSGTLQVVRTVEHDGTVVLQCPIRKTAFQTTVAELVLMRMKGDLSAVSEPIASHVPSGTPKLGGMTKEQIRVIARRSAYGRAAAREFPVGPKSPRLQRLVAEVAERLGDRQPPSCHSVYRWARRFVQSNYNTAVFMQDACVTRSRKPRVAQEVKSRLREHIQQLMSSYRFATLHGLTDLALALTARDLGHITFIAKGGSEQLVDAYISSEQERLRAGAKREHRTKGSATRRVS